MCQFEPDRIIDGKGNNAIVDALSVASPFLSPGCGIRRTRVPARTAAQPKQYRQMPLARWKADLSMQICEKR
jgi:hypothetical protein